mgnify:CR=1 FL=1
MNLKKVEYSKLKAKQKENYNFHKVAAKLADYGYNSMRLNDDWQGADFISVHNDGTMLKIQLKGRLTISKKYLKKHIYVAFIENEEVKIYNHDTLVEMIPKNIKESVSWKVEGAYSWGQTPKIYDEKIINL